jgi:arylsulfatase A-like enzyme
VNPYPARRDEPPAEPGHLSQKRRPNILFFFTDDQRFDTIRALGNDHIHTPTMDSLVHDGIAFTRAHIMGGTCAAVCMPSRAMLMTGRTLFHIEREGQSIPLEHVMLGEALRQAGYVTFGTGKWHNSPAAYARSFADGAEIFFGGMDDHWKVPACDFDPTGQYPAARKHTSRHGNLWQEKDQIFDHIHEGKHSSDLFCDAAIEFLTNYHDERPFFAYISFMAPHDPRETHQRYHDLYSPDDITLPPNWMPEHPFDNGELWVRDEKLAAWPRTPQEIRKHIAEYYAMITHADAQMGRVLQTLQEIGQADHTIVVFAGDNGLAIGQHGLMGKQNMYDHSLRVPLVMSGPAIPKNAQSDAFCYLSDIYPTLCELIGLPVPASVEGQSLVPAMRDGARIRDTMYFAYRDIQRCVRDDRYKLIEYVVDGQRTTQLFDIQADRWETSNLAADPAYVEYLARLRQELVRWRDELDDDKQAFWQSYSPT